MVLILYVDYEEGYRAPIKKVPIGFDLKPELMMLVDDLGQPKKDYDLISLKAQQTMKENLEKKKRIPLPL